MTPGIWQILLIVLVVLLIFGAGKLPNVMGDLAKGVRNFKKGLEDEPANNKNASDPKAVSDNTNEKTSVAASEKEGDKA